MEMTVWNLEKFNGEKFQIPEINCSFRAIPNPSLNSKCIETLVSWHRECNFLGSDELEKFLNGNPFIFSQYLFSLVNRNIFPYVVKILDMFIFFDDLFLERVGMITEEDIERLFNREHCSGFCSVALNVYGSELWKIIDKLYEFGNRNSVNIFLMELKNWCKSALELHLKLENIDFNSLTFQEYLDLRYIDAGYYSVQAVTVIDCQDIPKEIRLDHSYQNLLKQYSFTNLLINDLYSFKRDQDQNYIKIRSNQCGSIQKSIDFVSNEIIKGFDQIQIESSKLQMKYPSNQTLKEHIERLKLSIAGSLHIHKELPRYKDS